MGDPNTWMSYSPIEKTGRIYFRLLVGAGTATVTERDSGYIDLTINPTIDSATCSEGSNRYLNCSVTVTPGTGTISSYQ